jgi:hypothetical protein
MAGSGIKGAGLTGIYWDEDRLAYRAWVYRGGRDIYVGQFDSVEAAKAAQEELKQTPLAADPSGNGNGETDPLAAARYQKLQAQADREIFMNAILRGELVRTDDVKITIGSVITQIKNQMLGLPAAMAPLLLDKPRAEVIRILSEQIEDIFLKAGKLDPELLLRRNERLTKYQQEVKDNNQTRMARPSNQGRTRGKHE